MKEVYTSIITVKDCTCPSLVLADVDPFCQGEEMFDLNNLKVDAADGTWSMVVGVGDVPVIVDQMLIISSSTEPGDYMLLYTLNDLNIP